MEAVKKLLHLNETKGSPLQGRIDPLRIGAAGHSQGSTGVINAHTRYPEGSVFRALAAIALPALHWCDPEDKYVVGQVKTPLFIVGGMKDRMIAPLFSNLRAFEGIPAGTKAVMAMAQGAGHNEIQGTGGRYGGYLTAWLRCLLMDDAFARQAFWAEQPEIAAHPNWKHTRIKPVSLTG